MYQKKFKTLIRTFGLLYVCLFCSIVFVNAQHKTASTKMDKATGQHGESFQSFAFNGSWGNQTNAKAVFFEGEYKKIYAGWVDNYGNITIGSFDHNNGKISTRVIAKSKQITDKLNPALLIDKKGTINVFYYAVSCDNGEGSILLVQSENTEDIMSWKAPKTIDSYSAHTKKIPAITPFFIDKSEGEIGLLWSENKTVRFSKSQDNGINWEKRKDVLVSEPGEPVFKVHSNNKGNVHLLSSSVDSEKGVFSDGKYFLYKNGSFQLVKENISGNPVYPWDIRVDDNGQAVFAYESFPGGEESNYCYASWDGKTIRSHTLLKSGGSITDSNAKPSGGMAFDHDNPYTLFLSVKRDSIFEIEKWTTKNRGKSWRVNAITKGSEKNNIRPAALKGTETTNDLQVLWMTNTTYPGGNYCRKSGLHWADRFQSSIKFNLQSPSIDSPLDPSQMIDIMRQTADWQFANPYDLKRLSDWHWGTYYVGLQMYYEITKEERYKQEMINIGNGENWKINDKILYADMLTVISNWAWLYGLEKDPRMIDHSKWVLDVHLATRRAYKADVTFAGNPYFDEWWTWCDALFVAPPAFAQMYKETGRKKYLDYADKMFWITSDYLYSKEDSLMYRDDRYFDKLSENGKKIFWGRGNGWVIAGVCRMLDLLPEDYPSKEKYESMYKEMAVRLLDLQGDDWGWRVSLLDPEYQDEAEMSGSAFYVYALAWGLNKGLLDEKYRYKVEKGWKTLCKNVNKNGRLGNVQPEGIDPRKFTPENWQVYGTGAFLMAGCEMYKLITSSNNW